jgi:hypothetical protein
MTMQIGSISSVPAIDAAPPASPTVQSHGSGSVKTGVEVAGETSATAASGVPTSGVSAHISSSKGASQSEPGVLSPLDEALAAVYTTSVAGHDYLGTVQQTAGQYVASAADPPAPPITGIGSSIQAAENNLTVVIDEMV